MNKFFILIIFTILFSKNEFVDGVVAKVGSNTILYSDVLQTIQMQAMQNGIDLSKNPYYIDENHDNVLDFLINQNVLFEMAKKDTLIDVSGDEISSTLENEIDMMKRRAGSESILENILGVSIHEYKLSLWNEIEKRLLIERYQQSFMVNISVSRAEIITFYDEYKDSIPLLPSRSKFSLIELPIQPSWDAENIAIDLLTSIKDSILQFNNFEDYASKYSQDPGSNQNGGDLGYILRGNLVNEFEEVAFSLNVGEISEPVKTKFGFHLIQLLDKQGEKIHVRHILQEVIPTENDKKLTEEKLRTIYQQSNNKIVYFDSLAYQYQADFQNQSGVFELTPDDAIPVEILSLLNDYSGKPELLIPIESSNKSYYLVFVKDRKLSEKATLKNSWQIMEAMAKNNKITKEFEMWITKERENIFIQTF
ncbi:MAG: peptidylprolyl isomerase [Candidatus Marinimicrobia bacterium]|nr:peptidylprolyl isomerase [Candidatus Neomarinimicrobiota bacterium]